MFMCSVMQFSHQAWSSYVAVLPATSEQWLFYIITAYVALWLFGNDARCEDVRTGLVKAAMQMRHVSLAEEAML